MMPGLALTLDPPALGRLMPLHLHVGPDGAIRGTGPTMAKLLGALPGPGCGFLDLFDVQRPRGPAEAVGLAALRGGRIRLALRAPPRTVFKGLAVALGGGAGWLINLSFGIGLADAVREHRLTDADFAATDLAVEMLYLIEAKTAVLDELRRLNLRLQNAKSAAEELALTDTLTGLRNRRAMDDALAGAAVTGTPLGLIHVDLDWFKQVNDSLGHAAGDAVLVHVARVLREETRGGDVVARIGGDEFVAVFPGLTDADALDRIARRILARIEEPVTHDGSECRVSASIGITSSASYPACDPDILLNDADRALYASKRAGRGRITFFSPDVPRATDAA
jgi:diguanylate cyclase (GGDEF)-like protein